LAATDHIGEGQMWWWIVGVAVVVIVVVILLALSEIDNVRS
jgi:Na+-transporting methylmalonyl-CoA/oxaloacetate decarboxylase gamma subunit